MRNDTLTKLDSDEPIPEVQIGNVDIHKLGQCGLFRYSPYKLKVHGLGEEVDIPRRDATVRFVKNYVDTQMAKTGIKDYTIKLGYWLEGIQSTKEFHSSERTPLSGDEKLDGAVVFITQMVDDKFAVLEIGNKELRAEMKSRFPTELGPER